MLVQRRDSFEMKKFEMENDVDIGTCNETPIFNENNNSNSKTEQNKLSNTKLLKSKIDFFTQKLSQSQQVLENCYEQVKCNQFMINYLFYNMNSIGQRQSHSIENQNNPNQFQALLHSVQFLQHISQNKNSEYSNINSSSSIIKCGESTEDLKEN
jgi:hypothetical protein